MSRRIPALLAVAALVTVVAVAATGTWREATAQGWLGAGYHRLVRDAFWRRFDPAAAIALGVLVLLAVGAALARRPPTRRAITLPLVLVAATAIARTLAWGFDQICPQRPNVVLVSIDTLRADRLGPYGYARATSPTLDRRLADEGVVFDQAWSQSPKTTPSHMTMLTSLYPSVHGVPLWEGRGAAPSLNPRVTTLAEALKDAGYATAAFTAGGHMHRDRGFAQGFDVYKHGDQLRRTLAWLDAHPRRPFFLFFHTYEVHDPYVPPPEVAARFAADPVPAIADAAAKVRRGVGGWPRAHKLFWAPVDAHDPRHVRYLSDLYDAGIARMDGSTLSALLDRLDTLGLADRTLVVFTSDHGEAFQEHGTFLHEDLHAETLHVPLVIRFPRWLPNGRHVDAPVGLVDVAPTILDLLFLPPLPQAQGRSLKALSEDTDDPPPPEPVFAEHGDPASGRLLESVRADGWTLVRDGDTMHLYDARTDPGEAHDLAAAEPVRVAALGAALARWHDDNARLAPRWQPRAGDSVAPSKHTIDQLRALGYVE